MKQSRITVAALLATALMLTGCSGNVQSVPDDTSSSVSEQTELDNSSSAHEETSAPDTSSAEDNSEPKEAELPVFLTYPDGERVRASEIDTIAAESELSPEQLTADNWWNLTTSGFAYLAEPSGFNQSTFEGTFSVALTDRVVDEITYRRVNVGESICGFKVKSANCSFSAWGNAEQPNGVGFIGGTVELDGTVELTGWARLAPEDDGYTARGDVEFVVDSDSMKLPVMYFFAETERGVFSMMYPCSTGSESWINEYPSFSIGNAFDENPDRADVSMLPSDGTYARVKITLDNITLNSTIDFYSNISATLSAVEIL